MTAFFAPVAALLFGFFGGTLDADGVAEVPP
jgi:hypothetical protein